MNKFLKFKLASKLISLLYISLQNRIDSKVFSSKCLNFAAPIIIDWVQGAVTSKLESTDLTISPKKRTVLIHNFTILSLMVKGNFWSHSDRLVPVMVEIQSIFMYLCHIFITILQIKCLEETAYFYFHILLYALTITREHNVWTLLLEAAVGPQRQKHAFRFVHIVLLLFTV